MSMESRPHDENAVMEEKTPEETTNSMNYKRKECSSGSDPIYLYNSSGKFYGHLGRLKCLSDSLISFAFLFTHFTA